MGRDPVVVGAELDFGSGAYKAVTQKDGTFTIEIEEHMKGEENIPLVIKYEGIIKSTVPVWLHESMLKTLEISQ